MKKIVLLIMVLMLSLTLFGCGSSKEQSEIDTSTPEGVTKEYIRLVNNYEYSKASGSFTQEYSDSFVTLAGIINQIKEHNKLDESYIEKEPDVVKTNDKQSKIWYQYEDGQYVYFELIPQNDSWKIKKLLLWSQKENGDPK